MPITQSDYQTLLNANKGEKLFDKFPNALSRLWVEDYSRQFKGAGILHINTSASGASFTYLFDLDRSRTVGVWGMPIFCQHARDSSRMAGAPLGADPDSGYHRGHLIAHSIGGGMDINLVPQLGKVNIGAYRVLEREARNLAEEGGQSMYFVRTLYKNASSQMPSHIEQCLAYPNGVLRYTMHDN